MIRDYARLCLNVRGNLSLYRFIVFFCRFWPSFVQICYHTIIRRLFSSSFLQFSHQFQEKIDNYHWNVMFSFAQLASSYFFVAFYLFPAFNLNSSIWIHQFEFMECLEVPQIPLPITTNVGLLFIQSHISPSVVNFINFC